MASIDDRDINTDNNMDNNTDNNMDMNKDSGPPKPIIKDFRCFDLVSREKRELARADQQQIVELRQELAPPAEHFDILGRKYNPESNLLSDFLHKHKDQNDWTPQRKAEAENLQWDMKLRYAAKTYGPDSDEFRDIVTARCSEDSAPFLQTPIPSDSKGEKPKLNISSKLQEDFSFYSKEELKKDIEKARKLFLNSMALKDDDFKGDFEANKWFSRISRPRKCFKIGTALESERGPWNEDDDLDHDE